MKFITALFLLIFPFSTNAGMCSPDFQNYTNYQNQEDKYLYCANALWWTITGDWLNKVTKYPFSTTSFTHSKITSNCDDTHVHFEKLAFSDFSFWDKIKIIINTLVFIALFTLSILLFLKIKNGIKPCIIRAILMLWYTFLYLVWLYFLLFSPNIFVDQLYSKRHKAWWSCRK